MTTALQVVILAAGRGTRLGGVGPKCLTPLGDDRSILRQQIDNVRSVVGPSVGITVVVGHLATEVMTAANDVTFAYNPHFATTNTARSLAAALHCLPPGPIVWMNGDVVFDAAVLGRLTRPGGDIRLAVQTSSVSDEEVKYVVDAEGWVTQLSKEVPLADALGESVGVNYLGESVRPRIEDALAACDDMDYFEKGIETAISGGVRVRPVDVSDLLAVEVDTPDDLQRARVEYAVAQQAVDVARVSASVSPTEIGVGELA